MRTLVQIFTSRAELLDKDETTAEHGKNQREEAEKLEADKTNESPRNGGLFQGFFKPKLHPSGPIIDAEDGVARCPHCAWELEDESCLNCGYHVDDDSEGSDFTDDFSDMTDEFDGDMDEDMDDDDFEHHQSAAWRDPYTNNWAYPRPGVDHMRFAEQYFVPGPHVHFHPPHHHHHHHGGYWDPLAWGVPTSSSIGSVDQTTDGEGESNSEDEDEDEEMGSFIDDEEVDSGTDRSTVVGDHSYTNYYDFTNDSSQLPATNDGVEYMGTSSQSYDDSEHYYTGEHGEEGEEDEDEDSGSDEAEEEESGSEEAEEAEDEEDEDEGPIRAATRRRPPPPPLPQPVRRQQNASIPNAYSPAAQLSLLAGNNSRRRPHPSSAQRRAAAAAAAGTSASNAINVEDDSEDEMPVPARRRARLNRT